MNAKDEYISPYDLIYDFTIYEKYIFDGIVDDETTKTSRGNQLA